MDRPVPAIAHELQAPTAMSPKQAQDAHAVRAAVVCHPAIINELAASLRKMLLLYEGRALRRSCDRWEQEARDVLAKLNPTPQADHQRCVWEGYEQQGGQVRHEGYVRETAARIQEPIRLGAASKAQ